MLRGRERGGIHCLGPDAEQAQRLAKHAVGDARYAGLRVGVGVVDIRGQQPCDAVEGDMACWDC